MRLKECAYHLACVDTAVADKRQEERGEREAIPKRAMSQKSVNRKTQTMHEEGGKEGGGGGETRVDAGGNPALLFLSVKHSQKHLRISLRPRC